MADEVHSDGLLVKGTSGGVCRMISRRPAC